MDKNLSENIFFIMQECLPWGIYLLSNLDLLDQVSRTNTLRDKKILIRNHIEENQNKLIIKDAYLKAYKISPKSHPKNILLTEEELSKELDWNVLDISKKIKTAEDFLSNTEGLEIFEIICLARMKYRDIPELNSSKITSFLLKELGESSEKYKTLCKEEQDFILNEKLNGNGMEYATDKIIKNSNYSKISQKFSDMNGFVDVFKRKKELLENLKDIFYFLPNGENYFIFFDHVKLNNLFFNQTGFNFKILNPDMSGVNVDQLMSFEDYKKLWDQQYVPLDLRCGHDLTDHILSSFGFDKNFWNYYRKELENCKNQKNNCFYYTSFENCVYLLGDFIKEKDNYESFYSYMKLSNPEIEINENLRKSWQNIFDYFEQIEQKGALNHV